MKHVNKPKFYVYYANAKSHGLILLNVLEMTILTVCGKQVFHVDSDGFRVLICTWM